jgi:hypothetical protein
VILHAPGEGLKGGTMRCARIGLVAAAVVLAASAVSPQDVGYLDLTNPAPRQRVRNPNGGMGGHCKAAAFLATSFPISPSH